MLRRRIAAFLLVPSVVLAACTGGDDAHEHGDDTHVHEKSAEDAGDEHDDVHAEVALGTAVVGTLSVQFAQGHGPVVAGAEGHLVVQLPYADAGETVVRAWLGTEDRMASFVGKGTYALDHDDYDVHATAPDPLPANVRWWVELEQPDGTTHLGSIAPLLPE